MFHSNSKAFPYFDSGLKKVLFFLIKQVSPIRLPLEMICLILLQISFAENILLCHETGLENVEFMWNVEFFQSSAFIEFQ